MDWLDQPDLQRLNEQEGLWQVIQHLTAQLDASPQDARAYFLRGNAYLDQRCFDLARDDYTRALELTPDTQLPTTTGASRIAAWATQRGRLRTIVRRWHWTRHTVTLTTISGSRSPIWVSSQQPYRPTRRPSASMPTTGTHIIAALPLGAGA